MMFWGSNLRRPCRVHSAFLRESTKWERPYVSLLAWSFTPAALISSGNNAFYDQ